MTSPLTPERKQGIRERIEKLKAGERSVRGPDAEEPVHVVNVYRDDKGRRCTAFLAEFHSATEDNQANAELFAKSFTDLPDLLESHQALVEALKESRRQLCESEIQCLEPENSELCNHPNCLFCRWLDNIDATHRNAGVQL